MSNLINKTGLKKFADGFWTKIKGRYDNAFVGAEITANTETEKKIKFTKAGGGDKVDVSLADYARLQDRNEFKKDVSVDDAKIVSNKNIGDLNGPVTAGNRTTGYRGLTSGLFTDGYVKLLRIHLPPTASGEVRAHVWAIKKGTSKTEDKFARKIFKAVPVQTAETNKYIDVDIDSTFADETFFVLRTEGAEIQGLNKIKPEFTEDIINVNDDFRPSSTTENIIWNNFDPRTNLVGHMELHGRTGIVDISKRLEEINLASGNYVKQNEVSTAGGTNGANKVVRLGADGKLDANMLPSIAINEYISITTFTDDGLRDKTYENGDVVVATDTSKRYLCINKVKDQPNSVNDFIELNSKDGSVLSVNGKSGAITLALQATEDKFKLNITSDGSTATTEVDIISDTEIAEILNALPQ